MSDKSSDQITPIVAEGVDEEPLVGNARQFSGKVLIVASLLSAFYAAFHMAALNGLSIRDWTGMTIPFLPRFPMETWNFRIVHVAGALLLGFMLFASVRFAEDDANIRPNLFIRGLSWLLLLPALFFAWRCRLVRHVDRRRRHVERHGCHAEIPRGLPVRHSVDGGDRGRDWLVMGRTLAAPRVFCDRPCLGHLRDFRGGLPDCHIRHANAQFHRHAFRAHRHFDCRAGWHVADP